MVGLLRQNTCSGASEALLMRAHMRGNATQLCSAMDSGQLERALSNGFGGDHVIWIK
jgi:hypothetical protein